MGTNASQGKEALPGSPFRSGPWLLVIGMHRSGTSAITGMLTALGLQSMRREDHMAGHESNPEHWESLTAYRINEDLLEHLGGSWDAPPDLPIGWEERTEIRTAHDPATLMAEAFPKRGPTVWKDPRACLLLAYWRRHLPPPLAAVLVWRPPLPVARSLQQRDGIELVEGLALWERYNRAALEGLDGVETLVVEYDRAVEDPSKLVTTLTDWLDSLEGFAPRGSGWKTDKAASVVSTDLRHQQPGDLEEDSLVVPEQQALMASLAALGGAHRPLRAAPTGPESPWTTALIERRRTIRSLERELVATRNRQQLTAAEVDRLLRHLTGEDRRHRATIAELEAEQEQLQRQLRAAHRRLNSLYQSPSWRLTRPLRAVLNSRPQPGPRGEPSKGS